MSKQQYIVDIDGRDVNITEDSGEELEFDQAESLATKILRYYKQEKPSFVYLMYSPSMQLYKIGMTSNPVENRRNQLRQEYDDNNIDIIHRIDCLNRREADIKEKLLHSLFADVNVRTHSGRNIGVEWFDLTQEDVKFICKSYNLFVPFFASFTFNPMALTYFVSSNRISSRHVQQILILTAELWAKYEV